MASNTAPPSGVSDHTPLCVDLDYTLLQADTLHESILQLAYRQPGNFLRSILWALRGRAYFKNEIAARLTLDPAVLPYNENVIALIREQRARGRRIVLATAAHRSIADAVARHLGVFDKVFATEPGMNLKGLRKRDLLVEQFGEGGFDYIGDSFADLSIFSAARNAILVERTPFIRRALEKQVNFTAVLARGRLRFPDSLGGLKLVFLPGIALVGAVSAFGRRIQRS